MTDAGWEAFPLEEAIVRRAERNGLALEPPLVAAIAGHARLVIAENPRLHLTTVVNPSEFVERHIGEAFEGATLLEKTTESTLIDLGSGNGYPGLPLSAVLGFSKTLLVDASSKKAAFLSRICSLEGLNGFDSLQTHVRNAENLPFDPDFVTMRAVGGWERLVPKLIRRLEGTDLLIWAGEAVEGAVSTGSWGHVRVVARHPLPGRDRSWVWLLRRR